MKILKLIQKTLYLLILNIKSILTETRKPLIILSSTPLLNVELDNTPITPPNTPIVDSLNNPLNEPVDADALHTLLDRVAQANPFQDASLNNFPCNFPKN